MNKNIKNIARILLFIYIFYYPKLEAEELDFGAVKSATSRFFSNEYRNILNKKGNQLLDELPIMQSCVISKNGFFKIHFDTAGVHAVENIDLNFNGIPDYIDNVSEVFDYVYDKEINSMQFNPPRTNAFENDGYYNIYVKDQVHDQQAYGYTTPVRSYKNKCPFIKWYSFITIDNDYSELDSILVKGKKVQLYSTKGIEALKVTAAHEFFHAVQYAYADDLYNGMSTPSVYEMASVCMEMIVYPELNDYLVYVNQLLTDLSKYPLSDVSPEVGYRYGIFFYMLCERYGDSFLKEYWETVETGLVCFKALEELLSSKNSSLKNEWMEFINWIYHTGKNAVPNQYFFFADKCKDIVPVKSEIFNKKTVISDYFMPYELVFIRVFFNSPEKTKTDDTADFFITNFDTEELAKQTYRQQQYSLFINNNDEDNAVKIYDTLFARIYSMNEYLGYSYFFRAGTKVNIVDNAYPQPFNKENHQYIYFPAPEYISIGSKVNLTIFTTDMKEIVYEQKNVIVDNENKVIEFFANGLADGIYIYRIDVYGTTEKIGKFIVK